MQLSQTFKLTLATLTVLIGVGGGWQTFETYKKTSELQALQTLTEAQLQGQDQRVQSSLTLHHTSRLTLFRITRALPLPIYVRRRYADQASKEPSVLSLLPQGARMRDGPKNFPHLQKLRLGNPCCHHGISENIELPTTCVGLAGRAYLFSLSSPTQSEKE